MLLSQAGVERSRDRGARGIQALTEQREALGETQGLPSQQVESERRETSNRGGS